jgi:hypothetical protein
VQSFNGQGHKILIHSRGSAVDILDDGTNNLLTGYANWEAHSPIISALVAKADDYSQTEAR